MKLLLYILIGAPTRVEEIKTKLDCLGLGINIDSLLVHKYEGGVLQEAKQSFHLCQPMYIEAFQYFV